MSSRPSGISSFIRGGQYLAHIGQMIVQNIGRALGLCIFVAIGISSYFYVTKMDGYDKYVLSIEFTAVTKSSIPFAKKEYDAHELTIYSPDGPNQQYAKVKLKERRLVPWYEAERDATLSKVKSVFWITVINSVLILITLSVASHSLGHLITRDKQTRGARKVKKHELIREVKAFNQAEAKKLRLEDRIPYNIDGVPYPLLGERQHTLLAGSTGTGKTQLLLRLMRQVHERGDRAVIYDKMRSFVPMFYNPETDYILNPLDERCPPWDIFADARNIVEWNSIANAIIQNESSDPYWTLGAKSIFANTANRLAESCQEMGKRPTMTDLLYLLTQTSIEDLHDFLKGTEAARHVNPTVEKQAASMLSTLSQSIQGLGFIKDSTEENPGISIRSWMADDTLKGKVFLTSRDDQHDTIQPILTMWMSLFNVSLMSQERSNDRLCWFFIDELPSLNKLPMLEAALAQARQYGGAYVLGIQLESQLEETYEIKGAQTIMGLTLTKAIFNPGDPKTAKTMADAIGKTELIRRNEGISLGARRIRDGVNMNAQITQEHIVLPEELVAMPNLELILKLTGNLPCATLNLDYMEIEKHHEGLILDPDFMTRYAHNMSSVGASSAAREIVSRIQAEKGSPGFDGAAKQAVSFAGDIISKRPRRELALAATPGEISKPINGDVDEPPYFSISDDFLNDMDLEDHAGDLAASSKQKAPEPQETAPEDCGRGPIPLLQAQESESLSDYDDDVLLEDPIAIQDSSKKPNEKTMGWLKLSDVFDSDEGEDIPSGSQRAIDEREKTAGPETSSQAQNTAADTQRQAAERADRDKALEQKTLAYQKQHRDQSNESGPPGRMPETAPHGAFGQRLDTDRGR